MAVSQPALEVAWVAMTQNPDSSLTGVAETLLFPLEVRALESQRPDALLRDEVALALVAQLDPGFTRLKQIRMDESDQVTLILRNREFDNLARGFLERCPDAVVVHVGCGLDARFQRVDNGQVDWYDLDLPEVIALRRQLIGGEAGRYHLLASSFLDGAWIEKVGIHRPRPFLFLAEGVLMYLEPAQVRTAVHMLRGSFPGCELIFDAFSPFLVRANNLRFTLSRSDIRSPYHWGLKRGSDVEGWDEGIRLLDAWFPFDQPEPRLAKVQWVKHVPFLARVIGIFHYRLGEMVV